MTAVVRQATRLRADTWAIVLAVAGFVIVAGYAVTLGSSLRFQDERDYVTLAGNLVNHSIYSSDGVTSTAYRAPGYALVLSVVGRVSVTPMAFRLFGAFLFALTIAFTYHVAKTIVNERAGLIAAALLLCNPLAVYTAAAVYPQIMAGCLLLGGLLLVLKAPVQTTAGKVVMFAVGAGLIFGFLGLTVPNLLVAAPVAAVWLWRRTHRVLPAALMLVCVALPVAGWTVRNQIAMESFIPISTNSGINLILGNSDNVTGDSGVSADINVYRAEVKAQDMDEIEQNAYFQREGINWIKANPGKATVLYGQKVWHNFAVTETLKSEGESSGFRSLLLAAWFIPVLALALLRLVPAVGGRLRPGELLLVAVYVFCTLATAVFFTRIRFRVPLEPILCILAASLIAHWWARRRPDSGSPATEAAVAADSPKAELFS